MKKLHYAALVAVASVTLRQKDGDETIDLGTHDFAVDGIPAEINDGDVTRSLAAYGLSSLLQDRTSSIKDPEERIEAMKAVYEQLASGQWRTRREPGQSKARIHPSLAEAVRRFFLDQGQDIPVEAVVAKLQSLDSEARKGISMLPQVKAHRAAYDAELAQAEMAENGGEGIDIAGLFA